MKIAFLFVTLLFAFNVYADALQARLYTYASEYSGTSSVKSLSFQEAAELAIKNSSELSSIKQERDEEALQIDKALNGLLPVVRASAARNTLDKDRMDYNVKAAQDNLNAKIKLKQILFSDAILAEKNAAEYKATVQRLIAESVRLDVIKEAADTYYARMMYAAMEQTAKDSVSRLNSIKDMLKTNKAPKSSMNTYYAELKKALSYTASIQKLKNEMEKKLSAMTGLTPDKNCVYAHYTEMTGHGTLTRLMALFSSAKDKESYDKLEKFLSDKALIDSAELKAVDELIKLNKMDIKTEKRKFNTPNISLSGEYTQYLDKNTDTSEYSANLSDNDWNVSLRLSMPVFDGKKSSPDLYAKNTELMQYFHKRAEVRAAVKTRMENAVEYAGESGQAYDKAKKEAETAKNDYFEKKKQFKAKKIKSAVMINAVLKMNTAEENSVKTEYSLINSLTDIQRAYGKFFAMNEDSDDKRFLFDMEQALKPQIP